MQHFVINASHSITSVCNTAFHLLAHECRYISLYAITYEVSKTKMLVASYSGMIAISVIPMKVRSWIVASAVGNLLPTDNLAKLVFAEPN